MGNVGETIKYEVLRFELLLIFPSIDCSRVQKYDEKSFHLWPNCPEKADPEYKTTLDFFRNIQETPARVALTFLIPSYEFLL